MKKIEQTYAEMHVYHLELMREVKGICEANNIKYYLIGGTLLGAVRHNGFIPWDDDADIAIKREDYQRFIDACRKCLSSKYRLDVCFEDPSNFVTIIKIKYKGIEFVEESNSKLNVNHELFIDVFPLDKVSDDLHEQEKQKKDLDKYKFLIYGKYGVPSRNAVKGFMKRFLCLLYPCRRQELKKHYIAASTKYNNKDCIYYRVFGSTYEYSKEFILASALETTVELDFEGEKFTTFSSYIEYLRRVYGDYMSLPPKEKRYGYKHAALRIDLPKKDSINEND